MNRGDDESGSETEEKALIQCKPIDTVIFVRRMMKVSDRYLPITLSLLAVEDRFFGIKVTLFDPVTVSDSGFFLTVDQKSWERTAEEKQNAKGKDKLQRDYSLAAYLQGKGFEAIFKQMEVRSRKQMAENQHMGHDISKKAPDLPVKQEHSLGDLTLYYPSQYGSGWTSVDLFQRVKR